MTNQDLAEVLEQQAATNAILEAISDSPGDLESVFDMIARNAKKLCHARFCGVFQFDGNLVHLVAHYGISAAELEVYRREFPRPLGPETAIGRALLGCRVVCIRDVKKDREYGSALIHTLTLGSIAAAPMLSKGKPLGGIVVVRSVAEPFLDRQIDLLRTFSVNASIAVENTRLLQELQASNRELSEMLSFQIATSEVLRLIANSPIELQAVFDMIARNARELCQGQFSDVLQYDGELVHLASHDGLSAKRVEKYQKRHPRPPGEKTLIGRAIAERKIVHVWQAREIPDFSPFALAPAGKPGCMVAVPMLREENPVGVIAVWRRKAEPFSDKQIELLKTFARLATLAVEDVRLFREASRQQAIIREVFGKYVPQGVVEAIVSGKGHLEPIQTTATVLYSDLEAFTSIVEDMPPMRVVQMLNEYFPAVIEPVNRHGGVVNQFQGDAMLVTFNVPVADPHHADEAVKAACEIQEIVKNRTFAGISLRTRIGINTGTVIAGNVGSGDRVNYTVHGDAVNLAARLEQLNKVHGTLVLVSGSTVSLLTGSYPLESVGEVTIRGKHKSIEIFKLAV